MPGLRVKAAPLVAKKAYPADVGTAVKQLENSGNPAMVAAAGALRNVQSSLNEIMGVLRNVPPDITEIAVTDITGKIVAFLGDFEYGGAVTRNYFSELHIGDPYGTGDPSQAVINVNSNGQITVGATGWVDVVDPFGLSAAWLGTQYDTLVVTGAVTASGLIRLTVPSHAFVTGDPAIVLNVGGVPNAVGTFTVTKIDATHVDLQASVFTGTYTSGGTITRLLHVTGAVNNGAGLIRLTVTAHGYETADKVNVLSVGGVAAAAGQWLITVISANTFDLRGSTFAGTYTTGGTCIRYFAGGNFQNIAVGPSFANYRLRAFPDGTLKIRDATIVLNGAGGTITLDPVIPSITELNTINGVQTRIENGLIYVEDTSGGGSAPRVELDPNVILLVNISGVQVGKFELINSQADGKLTVRNNGSGSVVLSNGTVDATDGYKIGGTSGVSLTRSFGISLNVNYLNVVTGTPGTGQSTGTVVGDVSLNVQSHTWTGGIITT